MVKWAGGKTRLLDRLIERLPAGRFGTYAEPFFGGGAMFFRLASEPERRFDRALLSDKNKELVALYRALKSKPKALVRELRTTYQLEYARMPADERRELYYAVRSTPTDGMTDVQRGARLLFLNKTCFNGLWRVNAAGQFNVPFGRYDNPRILDEEGLLAAGEALACAEIVEGDYTDVTKKLGPGDVVYFDPPYAPVSKTANFTAYSARFGWDEQKGLAVEARRIADGGAFVMLSNASTAELRTLYEEHGFAVDTIRAARAINSDPSKRGDVDELVVTAGKLGAKSRSSRRKVASA